MKSSYYIALRTNVKFTPDEYHHESGMLAKAIQDVLGSSDNVAHISKAAAISKIHTEVEISHDVESGMVAKCVVDMEAPSRVYIDKSKLTSLMKSATDFTGMKVEKRMIESEEFNASSPH